MEQLLVAVPGSFNTEWGVEVWKKVDNAIEDKSGDRSENEPVVGPVAGTTVLTTHTTPLVIQPSPHSWNALRSISQPALPPHHCAHIGKGVVHELQLAHVSPTIWNFARAVVILLRIIGEIALVRALRRLHHLCLVPTPILPGFQVLRICLETSVLLKGHGNYLWQERAGCL